MLVGPRVPVSVRPVAARSESACETFPWREEGVRSLRVSVVRNPVSPLNMFSHCSYTGNLRNSGTDAEVEVVLVGKKASTEKMPLANSQNKNKWGSCFVCVCQFFPPRFERGQMDRFVLTVTRDLGPIDHIHIAQSGTGLG